jgi:sugar transferase (PEP-CTERM/EpsH1 system associated)
MARPDLLFLVHRIPFPPNKGDKIRAHALLLSLAREFRVHLGCFVDDPEDMAHCDTVRELAGGECLFVPLARERALMRAATALLANRSATEGYFHHRDMRTWVAGTVRGKGIGQAVVFGSAMAPYLLDGPAPDLSRCILDMVDVDSDKWAQYARDGALPKRWLYGLEARRVRRLEIRASEAFGYTALVSPFEAETFRQIAPHLSGRILSIANGVDLSRFHPATPHPSPYPPGVLPIVMTGLMDYWPNIQGAEWFARQVLPVLVHERAHFYVVGANPPRDFLAGLPNVTVTGRVEDIRPYLAHAAVAVAPLLIARGVQNKVLEAMAMGRPLVATSAATRALAVTPGRHLLVADAAPDFAAAVTRLLDEVEARRFGSEGRRYVERHHRWPELMGAFSQLLAAPKAGAAEAPPPLQPCAVAV